MMEAKDTVKIPSSHSEGVVCPHCGDEFGIEEKVLYEREAQAEISFKVGKAIGAADGIDVGRLEVVEWVEENLDDYKGYEFEECSFQDEWQAQLKSWGIEKEGK